MRLAETGYTKEDIKGLVAKYMIDTYERFPMIASTRRTCTSTTKTGRLIWTSMRALR